VFLPNFLAANFGRALDLASRPVTFLHVGLAGAGVEAAFVAGPLVNGLAPGRHAVLLIHPFAAFLVDGLAGRNLLAHGFDAILVASFRHILVAGLAHFLDAGLLDRLANLAADLLDLGLLDRLADGVAAFANILFTDLLGDLYLGDVGVRLINGLARRDRALLDAGLLDGFANGVTAFLEQRLLNRFANGLDDFFVHGVVNGLADGVLTLLVASLLDRAGAILGHRFVARFLDGFVASLAFLAVASLADRLHDGLLDGVVAGVPPLFQDCVVHKLVGRPALLLTRCERTLRIAGRFRTTCVLGCAAMCCESPWYGSE
jgi:hypothetical protein